MSKLFSLAKINLEHARMDFRKLADDDCYMETCCFALQQCIEFQLKGIVELHGFEYAENHEIRSNLNILNRNNIEIPCEKELRHMAGTLYQWETESRYKDSFVAALEDIKEVFTYADKLFDYIGDRIQITEVSETDFPDKKLGSAGNDG
ncbi:MAG: HEPN domain-containing protein [Eubacteriales bacterium]|nr:HEPN domain-containing protein [Eubacteriales bacterium]